MTTSIATERSSAERLVSGQECWHLSDFLITHSEPSAMPLARSCGIHRLNRIVFSLRQSDCLFDPSHPTHCYQQRTASNIECFHAVVRLNRSRLNSLLSRLPSTPSANDSGSRKTEPFIYETIQTCLIFYKFRRLPANNLVSVTGLEEPPTTWRDCHRFEGFAVLTFRFIEREKKQHLGFPQRF